MVQKQDHSSHANCLKHLVSDGLASGASYLEARSPPLEAVLLLHGSASLTFLPLVVLDDRLGKPGRREHPLTDAALGRADSRRRGRLEVAPPRYVDLEGI